MDSNAKRPAGATVRGGIAGGTRAQPMRALRIMPTLAALTIWCAFIGACGRSIFPKVSDSPTPTGTITTSPTTGNFLYSTDFADAKVAAFTRNLTTGVLARIGTVSVGSVNGPVGIANGPSAKFLYVANSADGNVSEFKINSTTGKLAALSGSPVAAGSSPNWIAVTPNGQFAFATNLGDGTISQYTVNTTTGALTPNGAAFSSPLLSSPTASVASNSWLYVTDATKGTIGKLPRLAQAASHRVAGTATSLGGSATPGTVIMDSNGQLRLCERSEIRPGLLSDSRRGRADAGRIAFPVFHRGRSRARGSRRPRWATRFSLSRISWRRRPRSRSFSSTPAAP